MINATNLTKSYGETLAVDNLTFTIKPGIVTGFLGPNGSGKSTTMRMILGLDAPTSGTATVGGRPLAEHANPLQSIGFLLDAGAVHPTRSAYDHLRALAITNGIGASRVDEVLDVVGLSEVSRRRSGGFSLGMGQRLGIAAALLGDPEVVMLDEPVNGLDPEGILWIRNLLQDLAKQGRTVFVSSHLMSEMELMAEHFVIIGQGRLIEDISAEDLRARATSEKTHVRADRLGDLVGLMRRDGVEITSGERETVSVRGLDANEIGIIARDNGIALASLVPEQRSLEDLFMSLTADSVEYHGGRATVAA
ncbi:MAG: ATP-binding cassette domain-containing protein [Acidimicrobiales bacterium]|nr:ATP-binding cassette domain-containing protein [Acidimicrobiales bacterium]